MGLNLGRLATLGLLAGLTAGAYTWMQKTPQGRRTLQQLQRQLQGGGVSIFGLTRPRGPLQSTMETVAKGTRDLLERGSEIAARRLEEAQPTLRIAGERLGTMGSSIVAGAGQIGMDLGETIQRTALPTVAAWAGRRLRRAEELEDITGERPGWRRAAPTAMALPAIGFGAVGSMIGRFFLGLFQIVLTGVLWTVAIAAFIMLVYRPEQFRLETLRRMLSSAFDTTQQTIRWLIDQVSAMAGTRLRAGEYGRRQAA